MPLLAARRVDYNYAVERRHEGPKAQTKTKNEQGVVLS